MDRVGIGPTKEKIEKDNRSQSSRVESSRDKNKDASRHQPRKRGRNANEPEIVVYDDFKSGWYCRVIWFAPASWVRRLDGRSSTAARHVSRSRPPPAARDKPLDLHTQLML